MNALTKMFGRVWTASGAQGTFNLPGEYKHHWPHWLWNLLYTGTTFCAKTVTTGRTTGNTELKADGFSVKRLLPSSIWITPKSWWKKYCLNCFGLSNAGIRGALNRVAWQRFRKPLQISWMPVTPNPEEEADGFVAYMKEVTFKTDWALQFNASCPNVDCDIAKLAASIREILNILQELGVPIFIKVNALFPIELALDLQKHPACAGFIMGNTIPFGAKLPNGFPQIPWMKLFGTDKPEESPLAKRFNGDLKKIGALSGKHLLPVVCHWIREARKAGLKCHINAGGGIMGPIGAWKAFRAGADSISLGTISMFRPWMIPVTTLFVKIFCKPHRK